MIGRAKKILGVLAAVVFFGYVAYTPPEAIQNNAEECVLTTVACGWVLFREYFSSWRQKYKERQEHEKTAQSISYSKD